MWCCFLQARPGYLYHLWAKMRPNNDHIPVPAITSSSCSCWYRCVCVCVIAGRTWVSVSSVSRWAITHLSVLSTSSRTWLSFTAPSTPRSSSGASPSTSHPRASSHSSSNGICSQCIAAGLSNSNRLLLIYQLLYCWTAVLYQLRINVVFVLCCPKVLTVVLFGLLTSKFVIV